MKRQLVFTKRNSKDVLPVSDKALEELIQNKYDFEAGYIPEGYNAAFLLIHDDKKDSRNDKWKIAFFKKTRKMNGTITLDNAEEFDENADFQYEIFKELDGNYEDVINISTDIIKKYRGKKEEIENKVSQ